MKNETEILMRIMLPIIRRNDKDLDSLEINWEAILNKFFLYESNHEPLENEISKLEIDNTKEVLLKLPVLYEEFINELAESYVLGNKSSVTNRLLQDENSIFSKQVRFLQVLKGVVAKMEREGIVQGFQTENTVEDKTIDLVFKKKGREDLKEKIKNWDSQSKDEPDLQEPRAALFPSKDKITDKTKSKKKIVQLTFVKYIVAASLILLVGISYFISRNSIEPEQQIELNQLENLTTIKVPILKNRGLAFADSSDKKALSIYFEDIYKNESESMYQFSEEDLTIYNISITEDVLIIDDIYVLELGKENFYIKLNNFFYSINYTQKPMPLKKLGDKHIIEQLEKIIYENE